MIITINDLPQIRKKHKNQKIVFCSGTFDLTHAGHVLFFEDCKKYGEILVVAVGNDFNQGVFAKGRGRPVQNEHIRLKMVDSIKPVDYALLDPDAENNDWFPLLPKFIELLKPEFYILNEDASSMERRKELMKPFKTKMIILPRTAPPEFDGISTTKMIKKIKDVVEK